MGRRTWSILHCSWHSIPKVGVILIAVATIIACSSATAPAPSQSAPSSSAAVPPSASTQPSTAPSKPAEKKTLRWAAVGGGNTWNYGQTVVAQAKGFFAAENLEVEIIAVGQSAEVCQQLIAKAVDVGVCSSNDLVQVVEASGAPLVQVAASSITANDYAVMAKPGLTSWSSLKGKTIMVGGPKDNTVYYFRIMARANGLKDSDYDFQYAGASSARLAALKSGAVDASMLTDPFDFQAEQSGFVRLGNLLPTYVNGDNYLGGGPIVRKDWAKDHTDELTRYLRALIKTTDWLYNPANKQEMFAIVGPKFNMTAESFDRLYEKDVATQRLWSKDGRMKDSAMQGILKSLVELGGMKEPLPPTNKFYDATYLEQALKSMGR